jgi:HlyD family secretion protein
MKKIFLVGLAIVIAAVLVTVLVVKQQSGFTKVYTARVVRQDLTSIVSGTGQIKPKTYVNVGATSFGRITHLYVKEGDHVTRGQILATVESTQPQASVEAQKATIEAARTDIASYLAAEKTAEANVEHAKADLEQKRLDWERAQALYKDGIMARQDYDAKKAAYDLALANVNQALAQQNQAKANTDSARGHLLMQQATLRSTQDALDKTVSTAPFDGVVTNLPVREGETVVVGIQNAEGSTLMTLADLSVVTAEVKVDETDIVNVKIGQSADVTVDAMPGKVFKGHVTLVGDQALLRSTGISTSQSTSGTEEAKDFKVVVTLDAPADGLRPGLSCTAKMTTAHKPSILVLPIQALTLHDPATDLQQSGKVQAASTPPSSASSQSNLIQGVFVAEKDKHGRLRARFVPVTTGIEGPTAIEVLSGLNQDQEIVTGPYKTLRDLKNNSLLKRDTAKAAASASGS